jgi:predicted transposase/invertase (TIGR01784 family)
MVHDRGQYDQKVREESLQEGRQQGLQEGLQEGRQQGERKTRLDLAVNMLQNDFSVQQVMKITGLSADELEDLKIPK